MLGDMAIMKSETERSPRRSRSEWEREIARWRASGLSASEYARNQGFKEARLWWWSAQLKRRPADRDTQPSNTASLAFLPVRVRQTQPESSNSGAACIEVVLGNGRCVRVVGALDVSQLERVLAAAEGGDKC
jgi:hypothetical protein